MGLGSSKPSATTYIHTKVLDETMFPNNTLSLPDQRAASILKNVKSASLLGAEGEGRHLFLVQNDSIVGPFAVYEKPELENNDNMVWLQLAGAGKAVVTPVDCFTLLQVFPTTPITLSDMSGLVARDNKYAYPLQESDVRQFFNTSSSDEPFYAAFLVPGTTLNYRFAGPARVYEKAAADGRVGLMAFVDVGSPQMVQCGADEFTQLPKLSLGKYLSLLNKIKERATPVTVVAPPPPPPALPLPSAPEVATVVPPPPPAAASQVATVVPPPPPAAASQVATVVPPPPPAATSQVATVVPPPLPAEPFRPVTTLFEPRLKVENIATEMRNLREFLERRNIKLVILGLDDVLVNFGPHSFKSSPHNKKKQLLDDDDRKFADPEWLTALFELQNRNEVSVFILSYTPADTAQMVVESRFPGAMKKSHFISPSSIGAEDSMYVSPFDDQANKLVAHVMKVSASEGRAVDAGQILFVFNSEDTLTEAAKKVGVQTFYVPLRESMTTGLDSANISRLYAAHRD